MTPKEVCYRCGQPENAAIHRKDYGGGNYSIDGTDPSNPDGTNRVKSETVEPYHGPTTHPYEPGRLEREGQ